MMISRVRNAFSFGEAAHSDGRENVQGDSIRPLDVGLIDTLRSGAFSPHESREQMLCNPGH